MNTTAKLNEYDKDEWRSIAMTLKPNLTEDEFERMWVEFCALKAAKELQ